MSCEVYANGDEIACKAGDGKVIAAFPDVCLTPPPPPAGPIPVPYPDTSFSKDMQNGSKTVKIKGKEVMLKDSSFYKSSPLGDEAATNSQGAGVITHVITGKTYFVAWSMDVKFENQNVDRHTDMTTSNHASPTPNTPSPALNLSKAEEAEIKQDKCLCCGGAEHASGTPMTADEWYAERAKREGDRKARAATRLKPAVPFKSVAEKQKEAADLLQEARVRPGCTCPTPKPKLLPEPPCHVFYAPPPAIPDLAAAQKTQSDATAKSREAWYGLPGNPSSGYRATYAANTGCKEVMHLVPLSAGGCPGKPGKDGNLQCKDNLCSNACRATDSKFSPIQTVNINN
jgi:Domain of unknown function (DUF4150)